MEYGFGSGILTGTRQDVAGSPIRFGALQDVAVEFTGDVKELFSTFQFPIDTARGKTKITGKAKVAQIRARMYNDLFFGQSVATGSVKYAYNESTTLGTGTPSYTVANSGSTPLVDQGIFYVSSANGHTAGDQLLQVTTSPGSSQYQWNPSTGVYTFSASDAAAALFVNYLYTVSGGSNIAISGQVLMGNTPRFTATLFQQFENKQLVLILNACVSTRLTLPTRIDDYMIQDLDFSAFADAAGNIGSWNSSE